MQASCRASGSNGWADRIREEGVRRGALDSGAADCVRGGSARRSAATQRHRTAGREGRSPRSAEAGGLRERAVESLGPGLGRSHRGTGSTTSLGSLPRASDAVSTRGERNRSSASMGDAGAGHRGAGAPRWGGSPAAGLGGSTGNGSRGGGAIRAGSIPIRAGGGPEWGATLYQRGPPEQRGRRSAGGPGNGRLRRAGGGGPGVCAGWPRKLPVPGPGSPARKVDRRHEAALHRPAPPPKSLDRCQG
jgi:hypothetical protein